MRGWGGVDGLKWGRLVFRREVGRGLGLEYVGVGKGKW